MQRRLERLRITFEESGVSIQSVTRADAGRPCDWQLARVSRREVSRWPS